MGMAYLATLNGNTNAPYIVELDDADVDAIQAILDESDDDDDDDDVTVIDQNEQFPRPLKINHGQI
jgi:hypothetical protein